MSKTDKQKIKTELKVLALVSDGSRTTAELKKAMRKDPRGVIRALVKDGSLEKKADVGYVLTRRGAGRLRFIPAAVA